jgi:FAD/FMN-containing dehydrogenase
MIDSLHEILSPDQIKTDTESIQYYGRDWTTYYDVKAQAIVFPESTGDVVKLVQWARKNKTGLVPSGGRTGLSGAAVATQNEVVVSFERMNKILDFNEFDQTVVIEPGVVTEQLQNFAVDKGFLYPVDFAARGSSQMGGNIATNAGGIKVVRYGLTRDWVMGLKVVTGTGEVLELNKGLIKNATGLDLRQLFIGSEGILGFVVEATMKLTPTPARAQVLLLGLSGFETLMPVFGLLKKGLSLSAFEMFSREALDEVIAHHHLPEPLGERCSYYVVAEFESPGEESETKALALFEKGVEEGWIKDGALSQSDAQAKTFWRYREDISESLAKYSPYKNDISVKTSEVPACLTQLDLLLKQAYPTWRVIWFGHLGDGNLHINILRPEGMDKKDFVKECQKVDALVFESVRSHAGAISAEHGVGLTKKPFLNYTRSEGEIALMRQIKMVFDPDGIMNPGKVFDLTPPKAIT